MRISLLLLIVGSVALFFLSCDTTENKEVVTDYTYSISKVFWSDEVDNNSNGYVTNKILWIHLNLEESVTRNVVAQIYFRESHSSTYSYYGTTQEFEFEGVNSPLTIQHSIGPPLNRELIQGKYDFKIEVLEVDSDRIEAVVTKEDTTVDGSNLLGSQAFEQLSRDQIYSINVWWKNKKDENLNGYFTEANLFVDVNIDDNVTKDVNAKLYYKEESEEEYVLLNQSSSFQITSNSIEDSIKFSIGKQPKELKQGNYDFKIVVYETGVYYPVAVLDPESTEPNSMIDSVRSVQFETSVDDGYFYSIPQGDVFWSEEIDSNNNGYTQSRRLNFNVNVDKNESRKIWAQIFFQHKDSLRSKHYLTRYKTDPQSINGGNDDTDGLYITIGKEEVRTPTFWWEEGDSSRVLKKGEYSFSISIYEFNDTNVVATINNDSTTVLLNQKFETATQDTSK